VLNSRYPGALLGALTLGLLTTANTPSVAAADTAEVARAKYLWSQSPHGKLLERILPPSIGPSELPEPRSEGARVMARYCVQCHYLPSPQMHDADKWTVIVVRMVWRMQGKGNLGAVMKEMMERVEAPGDEEVRVLTAYLRKHGQREMDPMHPALKSEAGQMFTIACTQCHGLPDPQRHTAREWPSVVKRMKRHMAWANTVVGVSELRTTPVLDTSEIVRFLQRHARAEQKSK
jgi:mono/diheme cytochrome c family protein